MKRIQSRNSNGRFTKNTLENTFGLHCVFCEECGIGNPWGINEQKPYTCHKCGAKLKYDR